MKIKICGLTRPKDVLNCEKYGADMMGFINIERSERYQTIGEIKKLLSIIKNKERAVLVIEPEDIEEVIMKMKKTGIRTVQLHSLDYNAIKYLRWIESYSRTCFEGNMTIIKFDRGANVNYETCIDQRIIYRNSIQRKAPFD